MRQSSRWSQVSLCRHLSRPAHASPCCAVPPQPPERVTTCGWSRHDARADMAGAHRSGTSIGRVTMTIHTSETPAHALEADALIVGVIQGPDGPRPAPGAREVDDALGGTLTDLLTALDATGRAEEITKIPAAGRLPVPVVVAVGLGLGSRPAPRPGRRARATTPVSTPRRCGARPGAAVRVLTAARPGGPAGRWRQRPRAGNGKRHIGLALPARDAGEVGRRRARCAARRVRVPPLPDGGHRPRRGADPADQRQRAGDPGRSRTARRCSPTP